MTASNPRAALFAAMAKAFPEIEGATKDSNNPHFKSKYADLGAVVDAIKPALVKHQLWFRQAFHDAQGGVAVETLICHASGEEVSCGVLFVPASKQDAQGYGSAITYARRYSLQTAFGVAPEDDDGNAASKPAKPRQPPANVNPEPDDPGGEEDVAAKVADWCDKQAVELDAIAKSGNAALLQIWHTKNSKALLRLKASHEAQYDKLMGLYDDVYSMLGKADEGPLPITFAG
jgi:hypothetical protein